MDEIAAASDAQSHGIADLNQAITQIDSVTRTNATLWRRPQWRRPTCRSRRTSCGCRQRLPCREEPADLHEISETETGLNTLPAAHARFGPVPSSHRAAPMISAALA